MNNYMRLTQIQQILEIEKCTSISQAARNLYISQPALSAVLNEFESEIGVQIFKRTKTGIQPTENGKDILNSIRNIMLEVNYIQNYTTDAKELSGNFSLLVGSSYEFLLAELIQRFKELFPKAHLIPNTTICPAIIDNVSKGFIDLAILAINETEISFNQYNNVEILPLKHCQTYAIMNPNHIIKNNLESISLSNLVDEQLVFGRQFDVDQFRESLRLNKYPLSDIDRITVMQLLKQDIAIYFDASPIPLEEYKKFYPDFNVFSVINDCNHILPNNSLNWPIYLIFRKNQNTRLQQLFINDVKEILQKHHLYIN